MKVNSHSKLIAMYKEYGLKFVVLVFVFISFNLLADDSCEMTKEYKEARIEAYRTVKGSDSPYSKCKDSMHEALYWKAVSKCKVEEKGKNVGGGCQHVAVYQIAKEQIDVSHCKVLKPKDWKKEAQAYLEFIIESRKIAKCK